MAVLQVVQAPHPIFSEKALAVGKVDEELRELIDDMFDTLYHEEALGLAAPMIGISLRLAIIDLREGGIRKPLTLIDPEITWRSEETQHFTEASISLPYVSAEITRPKAIRLRYTDEEGATKEMEAEGYLATVIQHEIDYLDGVLYPDHLSKLKQDMLWKKLAKARKLSPPHVHGPDCDH